MHILTYSWFLATWRQETTLSLTQTSAQTSPYLVRVSFCCEFRENPVRFLSAVPGFCSVSVCSTKHGRDKAVWTSGFLVHRRLLYLKSVLELDHRTDKRTRTWVFVRVHVPWQRPRTRPSFERTKVNDDSIKMESLQYSIQHVIKPIKSF